MVKTYTENHYGDYRATEQANSLRACGATIGGGSEVLVIEPIAFKDDITVKFDGGALRSPSTRCTGNS